MRTVTELYNQNCVDVLKNMDTRDKVLVIDPPFNIGYHYNNYKDKMKEKEYFKWLGDIILKFDKFVVIHYPEQMFKLSYQIGKFPEKTVSWVYNSNNTKQHRMIAFFGVAPDFKKVRQPYKNPNDKRIKKLIANGSTGSRIYDWWNINQVKNVSLEKTSHPCQMPLKVMENIIGILPNDLIVLDAFMGSGTTGVACKNLDRSFIGIELDKEYFEIAKERIGKL